MKAIILAAGKGERLKDITKKIPKPMLKINGEIILEHNIIWLKKNGIKDIYINLHYLPEVIKNYFDDGKESGVKISYSYEPEILGTAGAVRKIIDEYRKTAGNKADGPPDFGSFIVIYGDNFYPFSYNLEDIISFHSEKKGLATIGLYRKKKEVWKSGVVLLNEKSVVTEFIEKPDPANISTDLVNTGLYIMESGILDYIPDGYSDFGRDIFPGLVKDRMPVYGFVFRDDLIAIDTVELYKKINR